MSERGPLDPHRQEQILAIDLPPLLFCDPKQMAMDPAAALKKT